MEALVQFDSLQSSGVGFGIEVGISLAFSRVNAGSLGTFAVRLSICQIIAGKDRFRSVFFNTKTVLFFGAREFAVQNEFRIRLHRRHVPGIQRYRLGEGDISLFRFSKLIVRKGRHFQEFGIRRFRYVLKGGRGFAYAYAFFIFSGRAQGSRVVEKVLEISRRKVSRSSEVIDRFDEFRKGNVGLSDEMVRFRVLWPDSEYEFSSGNDLPGR